MTVSQLKSFHSFCSQSKRPPPESRDWVGLGQGASAGSGRPRRGGAAAARRRRSACGLRSRSTCRRARCSSCTCTPPCCTISTWTNRIPALAHGVVHQHGKAVHAPRAAVRRRAVAARRADAFAAKQRAACVEQPYFSHQLAAAFSGFVVCHGVVLRVHVHVLHARHGRRGLRRVLQACSNRAADAGAWLSFFQSCILASAAGRAHVSRRLAGCCSRAATSSSRCARRLEPGTSERAHTC